MTASSDYGVSIVESFTPPKNWIPGQEINKDVYSVNTGSVDAFVKEDVAGVLEFTYEDIVGVKPTAAATDKYVELGENVKTAIDGVTTEEAGGFLAWTDAQVDGVTYPTGSVNSRRVDPNNTDTDTKDPRWTPPATGTYIFRRSIIPAQAAVEADPTADPPVEAQAAVPTKYTYAGYYYVAPGEGETEGKYYKIVIGSDVYPTLVADATTTPSTYVYDIYASSDDVGVAYDEETGELLGTPIVNYVVEKEVSSTDVNLKYVAGATAADRDYLQVLYNTDLTATAKVDALKGVMDAAQTAYNTARTTAAEADSTLAERNVDLANAQGAYNSAKSRYDQTKADYDYAKALTDATNKLVEAAKRRGEVENSKKQAEDDLKDARDAMAKQADKMVDPTATGAYTSTNLFDTTFTDTLASTALVTAPLRTYITSGGQDGNSDLTDANNNLTNFDNKWTAISGKLATIKAELEELAAYENNADVLTGTNNRTGDRAEALKESLVTDIDELNVMLAEYQNLYATLTANNPANAELYLTGIITTGDVSAKTAILAYAVTYGGVLNTQMDTATTGLADLVDDFDEAYDAYHAYLGADGLDAQADTAWKDAIKEYNATVGTVGDGSVAGKDNATSRYEKAIDTVQNLPNAFSLAADDKLTNNAATLVPGAFATNSGPGYAAVTTGADPAIAETTPYTDYVTVSPTADGEGKYPVTKNVTRKVADEKDFTQLTADPSGDPQKLGDSTSTVASTDLKGKMLKAADDLATAQGLYDNAKTAKENADKAVTDKKTTLDQATAAYESADGDLVATSTINIKVYLDQNWKDYWEMDPDTDNTTNVDFYLKKILEAGETSHKLIDGVELDPNMSAKDYKNLTFDLNIGLDSIQVAYDADQRGYTTETVDAEANFAGMKATVDAPLTKGSTVTWTDNAGVPAPATP